MKKNPVYPFYDVVIIGGGIIGCAVAWFLSKNKEFSGKILVIEKDTTYKKAATSLTNSCIRQQFSSEINIRMSQFGASFINDVNTHFEKSFPLQNRIENFGYLYLATNAEQAKQLRANTELQHLLGVPTKILLPEKIKQTYPFFKVEDLKLCSLNKKDEGYFNGYELFQNFRTNAIQNGVEFIENEVISIKTKKKNVDRVTLLGNLSVASGVYVNCTGTNSKSVAKMIGTVIPVEPRKRYTFVFSAESRLCSQLPLTIDPAGFHVRSDGNNYMVGCRPEKDISVDIDNFEMDHKIWQETLWPALANRVPSFERIKVLNEWAGHYDFNTFDQNALIGYDMNIKNFIFACGFSGHGLQHAPAIGRGVSELITFGKFKTLDLSLLSLERLILTRPMLERCVI